MGTISNLPGAEHSMFNSASKEKRRSKKKRAKLALLLEELKQRFEAFALKARASTFHLNKDPAAPVVSLTSFPARIDYVWIPIECIFQQSLPPSRIILVLSLEEFPEKKIPKSLRKQEERGLEILWVERDTRSYKKFLPVKKLIPERDIVTIDDDVFYDKGFLAHLVEASRSHPGAIVGNRGWEIGIEGSELLPYTKWAKASPASPPELTLLTGVGGIYYPADVKFSDVLFDERLAMALCPTGDDIWFWAMARLGNTPVVCLGIKMTRAILQLKDGPRLWIHNRSGGGNDEQLAKLLSHFPNLIDGLRICSRSSTDVAAGGVDWDRPGIVT